MSIATAIDPALPTISKEIAEQILHLQFHYASSSSDISNTRKAGAVQEKFVMFGIN